MASMSDKITNDLKKLAQSLKLNEHELQNCIKKVKQLAPSEQKQYLNVLDNIKAQLKPISVNELYKVKSVLGTQKHSGPALLSHIEVCLNQSQLVENSLQQTKALIDQAYLNSLNDPGRRSKIIQQNIKNDIEEQNQLNPNGPGQQNLQQTNAPRPTVQGGNTLRSEAARRTQQNLNNPTASAPTVPLGTPLRSNFAILRPEMRALAKMLRVKEEGKKQRNIRHSLSEDAYVDEQILETDKHVDENILKTSRETNKELQQILEETERVALKAAAFARHELLDRTKDLDKYFMERQRSIKKELSEIAQQNQKTEPAINKSPQFSPGSSFGA